MEEKMVSLKKNAKMAGILYLCLGITAVFGPMYMPFHPTIGGDSSAVVEYIVSNEFLFRTRIISTLASPVLFIFLALALYRLFKNVNEYRSVLLVVLVLVQVPIAFILETFNITALLVLKGETLKDYDPKMLNDIAMLFVKTHNYGVVTLEIFWGLWLIPFGQLVYKSGFIPWVLGIFLIVGGMGYIIESLTILLFPTLKDLVSPVTFVLYSLGEFLIILWLLIKGIRVNNSETVSSQA